MIIWEEKDVNQMLECFDLIQRMLPAPDCGGKRAFPIEAEKYYRVINYNDSENKDLWNAIETFKKALNML